MKMYRDNNGWNLIDSYGILVCRGSYEHVMEKLKEYWH